MVIFCKLQSIILSISHGIDDNILEYMAVGVIICSEQFHVDLTKTEL